MSEAELVAHFPKLYHMAEDGMWESIRLHGLESTSALLDRYGVAGTERQMIESARRPKAVMLRHPLYGTAVIRDQRPMVESKLARCLNGMTPRQWYELLNRQVFFWPTHERLLGLLGAALNRTRTHCVLTIETAALLARQGSAVRLSPINSGSTLYTPQMRGKFTFLPVAEYPFADWCRRRGPSTAVAEVTVERCVMDIEAVAVRVERYEGPEVKEVLWERA